MARLGYPANLDVSTLMNPKASRKSPSVVIISRDSRGPYSHFTYPIGGPVVSSHGNKDVMKRNELAVASYVPDVLPIQLPTGDESAINLSSPTRQRASVAAAALPVMPTLEQSPGKNSKSEHL